jgi:hypothetical protein
MVQRLDADLREAIEDLLLAAVHADARTVTDAVWELCTSPPAGGRERLHADIVDLVGEYGRQTIAEVDVGALVNRLVASSTALFLPPAYRCCCGCSEAEARQDDEPLVWPVQLIGHMPNRRAATIRAVRLWFGTAWRA